MSTATATRVRDTSVDIRAWAQRMAASLPPFTAEEARAAGRLAAALDAKRRAA